MSLDRSLSLDRLRGLYQQVRSLLNPIQTREVLVAAAGLKASRLGAPPHLVERVEEVLSSFGLYVCRSENRFLARRDIGKGGWSNAFAESLSITDERGDWLLYVATTERAANSARDAEKSGQEDHFGAFLGIPSCCTEFFLSRQQLARQKQYDFTPLVLANTSGPYPFNYWTNFVAQYFCYSLISFFPCSFTCERAADVARATYDFLRRVNIHFADAFLRAQRQSILYTEYRGLFQFDAARYRDGTLCYRPSRIHTTVRNAAIADYLVAGNRLRIVSRHEADILSAKGLIKKLKGDNVSICIF